MHGTLRWTGLSGLLVLIAMVLVAPNASASVSPTIALDQSAGTTAGSSANLGVDLKFSPSSGDSPNELALNLPPGLLANASINGGACLTTTDLTDTACQVGSGTVTADALSLVPIPTPVTFDLVPPPKPGDLAGLAVNYNGTQIGSTGDVKVRPSGDPAGVGITIDFALPNSLAGVPISIAEINSTFDGLRYPATCPSAPRQLSAAVNSYSDPTIHTVAAPLQVTGCSSLNFSPTLAVTAARDSADSQVKLSTQVNAGASDAPSGSMTLAFPWPMLAGNLSSLSVLCPTLSSSCVPVGSVTAVSPLYPKPLSGQAYLTGTLQGLSLTLVFPSPFPLTLVGAVDLVKNSTTFTGLPDIPLTSLNVSLSGGAHGLFSAHCPPASGTATAALTDANGDKSVRIPSPFTIANCPSGSSGSGAGPSVPSSSISGLPTGHPSLTFKVRVGKHAAKFRKLTVELPAGLRFSHQSRAQRLRAVKLSGAKIRSLSVNRGHLIIVLRKPSRHVTVKIASSALTESPSLQAKAKSLHKLPLTVIVATTNGRHRTIHAHAAV